MEFGVCACGSKAVCSRECLCMCLKGWGEMLIDVAAMVKLEVGLKWDYV